MAERRLELERQEQEQRLALQRAVRELENHFPEERIRYEFVTNALPAIARAFVESLGEVHLTHIGAANGDGSGKGLGFLAESLAQILAVARAGGLDVNGIWRGSTEEQK